MPTSIRDTVKEDEESEARRTKAEELRESPERKARDDAARRVAAGEDVVFLNEGGGEVAEFDPAGKVLTGSEAKKFREDNFTVWFRHDGERYIGADPQNVTGLHSIKGDEARAFIAKETPTHWLNNPTKAAKDAG